MIITRHPWKPLTWKNPKPTEEIETARGGKNFKKLLLISELKNDIFNNETDIILAVVQSLL